MTTFFTNSKLKNPRTRGYASNVMIRSNCELQRLFFNYLIWFIPLKIPGQVFPLHLFARNIRRDRFSISSPQDNHHTCVQVIQPGQPAHPNQLLFYSQLKNVDLKRGDSAGIELVDVVPETELTVPVVTPPVHLVIPDTSV